MVDGPMGEVGHKELFWCRSVAEVTLLGEWTILCVF